MFTTQQSDIDNGRCFNMLCNGFVQVDAQIPIGIAFDRMSEHDGPQYEMRINIAKVRTRALALSMKIVLKNRNIIISLLLFLLGRFLNEICSYDTKFAILDISIFSKFSNLRKFLRALKLW